MSRQAYQNYFLITIVVILLLGLGGFKILMDMSRMLNGIGNIVKNNELAISISNSKSNEAPYTMENLNRAILSNERFENVFHGVIVKGVNVNNPEVLSVFQQIQKEMTVDALDAQVSKRKEAKIGIPMASYNEVAKAVEFFNKWSLSVDGPDSPWISRFPSSPLLAFHNEIIPWPTCNEGEQIAIAARPVSKIGIQSMPDVIVTEMDRINSWQVAFRGTDIIDRNLIADHRMLVVTSCSPAQ